jgi:DNA primase catalytic core
MTDFDRTKDAIDIVRWAEHNGMTIKRAGTAHKAVCIFHDDHDPSLTFYPDTCSYHCFACHADGDIFDLAMKLCNWTKAEALNELARYAGITLEPLTPEHKAKQERRERLYALMAEAAEYYDALLCTGGPSLGYLTKTRGLSPETIKAAQIGFAPGNLVLYKQMTQLGYTFQDLLDTGMIKQGDNRPYDTFSNRIVIPIRDHKGRIVAFSGRAMSPDHGPKYLHNATTEIFDKSSVVHKMPLNRTTIGFKASDTTVVVEGTIDPITGANAGVYNIASQMGTSLSDQQLDLLCAHGVTRLVFCLDNDTAGETALRRLVEKHIHRAAEKGVALYAMTAPYGKDADDTLREHPEMWQAAVDAAPPVVDVLIARELAKHGSSITGVQKSNVARALLPILKSDNPFIQQENIATLSRETGVSIDSLESWLIGRDKIHVLPKQTSATPLFANLPSLELIVLHGLIVNEDPQRWLDRANAVLGLMPFPKACAPLSQNDFSDKHTSGVMAMITTAVSKGIRPFDDEIQTQIGRGVFCEAYERALYTPEAQSVFATHDKRLAFKLDYPDFLRAVYRLRHLKLDMDIKHQRIPGSDLVEWVKARMYLWGMIQTKGNAPV